MKPSELNKWIPADEQEEFAAFLKKQIEEHPVVKQHHGRWKELIAWEAGEQYSLWDSKEQNVVEVRLVKRTVKFVLNLLKPLAEAIEGKINMAYQLAGTPNSSEISDVNASQIATKALSHNDYVNDIGTILDSIKFDMVRTGNAFMKWTWDTSSNGYVKNTAENGADASEPGEIICDVPSVFNIRPDPTATTRAQMRWIIELDEVTNDEILEKFPDIKKEDLVKVKEESGQDKYKGMNVPVEEKDKDIPTQILARYWERKSKKYPQGRYIMATKNGLFLHAGHNQEIGEIPFWHFGYKKVANSLWHTGPLHHNQAIQQKINRLISMALEHIEGWRAKMVVDKGANMKEGAFTTDSFEILELDMSRGGGVHAVAMPELSPQVMNILGFLMSGFDKVANVHEISYSQLPKYASRAPAALYSMMLEQENLKIDPMLKRINKNITEMGKFRLRMMDKYYKTDRLIKIIGKGNSAAIEYFRGSDLKGNYDVKLEIGVSLHQSKAIQQRMLIEMKNAGIITDNNKLIKMMNLGDIEEELRGDVADESRAIRENQAYVNDTYEAPREKGGVFVYIHDNHEVHLSYHSNLLKSEEAQAWPEKKWQHANDHMMKHLQFYQAAQAAMKQTTQPTPQPTQTAPSMGENLGGEGGAEAGGEEEVAAERSYEV